MIKLRFGLLLACAGILASCSPGHFVNSHKSERRLPRYQKISRECQNLHLSGSQLDVQSFRGLFGCLNSNGLFGPAGDYIKATTDEDLSPLVEVLNDGLLKNPKRFFELSTSIQSLEKERRLDSLFELIAEYLEHFHESAVPFARLAKRGDEFPELLKIIQWTASVFQSGNTKSALGFLKVLNQSKAFQTFASIELEIDDRWIESFQNFWKTELKTRAVERLIRSVADRSIYSVVDPYVDDLKNTPESEVSKFLSLWNFFWSNENGKEITEYFFYSNRPLSCFRGNAEISSYSRFVLGEIAQIKDLFTLSDYCRRVFSSGIFVGRAVCEFPAKIESYSDVIHRFSGTMALDPIMRFVSRIQRASPELFDLLHDLLVQFGGPDRATYQFFKKFEDQDVWRNFILVALLHGDDSREMVSKAARSLVEGEDAPIRLIAKMFSMASSDQIKQWFLEMRPVWDNVFKRLPHWIATIQNFYEKDRIHPISELASVALNTFSQDSRFFRLLLEERGEKGFHSTLKHLAKMSRDGRLKEIILSTIRIFDELASRGEYAFDQKADLIPTYSTRHNFSAKDFTVEEFGTIDIAISPACDQMDMSFGVSDYDRSDYQEQFRLYAQCLNSKGSYPLLTEAVGLLSAPPFSGGKPRIAYLVKDLQLASNLLSDDSVREIIGAFQNSYRDRLYDKFIRSFKGWNQFEDAEGKNGLQRFVEWLHGWVNLSDSFQSALRWISQSIAYEGFQQFLKTMWKWQKLGSEPIRKSPLYFDEDSLEDWVSRVECDRAKKHGQDWVRRRAKELGSEVHENVNAWEWVGGGPRKAWGFDSLWSHLRPVFERIKNKDEQAPSDLIYSIRNILRIFGRAKGETKDRYVHFTAEEMMSWMQSLAREHRLITYYYPGQSIPVARVVNGFDRLEIILHNADLVPFFRRNMGLKYLDMLAHAWGDEPRDVWPLEIRQKYSREQPPTLRETYRSIFKDLSRYRALSGSPKGLKCWRDATGMQPFEFEKEIDRDEILSDQDPELQQFFSENGLRKSDGTWVNAKGEVLQLTKDGLPFIPKSYQTRLFNAFQVIGVFEENLPDEQGEGGLGMRVLRNLAFEMMNSTPIRNRDSTDGEKNNLSLILKLGKSGLLRHLGWAISEVPSESKTHVSLFRVLSTIAGHSEFEEILKAIFQDPKSVTRWERGFKVLFSQLERNERSAHQLRKNSILLASTLDRLLSESSLGFKEAIFRVIRAMGPALRTELAGILDSESMIEQVSNWFSGETFWDRPSSFAFRGAQRWIDQVLADQLGLGRFGRFVFDQFFDSQSLKKWDQFRSIQTRWRSQRLDDESFDQILTRGLFGGDATRDALMTDVWKALSMLLDPDREETQIWVSDFYHYPNVYYRSLRVIGELAADGDQDLFFRIFMGLTDSSRLTEALAAP